MIINFFFRETEKLFSIFLKVNVESVPTTLDTNCSTLGKQSAVCLHFLFTFFCLHFVCLQISDDDQEEVSTSIGDLLRKVRKQSPGSLVPKSPMIPECIGQIGIMQQPMIPTPGDRTDIFRDPGFLGTFFVKLIDSCIISHKNFVKFQEIFGKQCSNKINFT